MAEVTGDPSSPQRMSRSIDFLCEEERIRRLGERIRRERDEASELSRERRARYLARELRASGLAVGNTGLPSQMIATAQRAERSSALPVPESLPVPSPVDLATAAVAANEVQQPPWQSPGVPGTVPKMQKVSESSMDPKDRLNDALDQITVKGIVDFRGIAEPTPEVEAVAIAVLRLLNSQARESEIDGAAPLPPAQSWLEVKRTLLKPGHLVNALRRFPYAAERGQVPEEDICDVEEVLAEVPFNGQGLEESHPTAAHLYSWVRAALEYAAWSHTRLDSIASPARASASSAAPPRPAAAAVSEQIRPAAAAPSFAAASGYGGSSAISVDDFTVPRSPRGGQAGYASTNAAPAALFPSNSPATVPIRGGGGTFGGPPASSSSFGGPAVASSGGLASFAAPPLADPYGFSAGARQATAIRPHSPGFSGVSVPKGSTSPARTATSPARTATRSPARTVAKPPARARSPAPVASLMPPDMPVSAAEVEANQRKLEVAKKEVREIRSLEQQVKWGMEREEKKEVEAAKKDAELELMEWREEQNVGMQEYQAQLALTQKVEDLQASKDFQHFKREKKQAAKEAEIQQIKEEYQADREHSEMQADIARTAIVDRHAIVIEQLEDIQDQREIKMTEALQEKAVAQQDRAVQQRLTYDHQANQLANEKEELLKSLQLMRSRQKLPVTSNRGLTTAGRKR